MEIEDWIVTLRDIFLRIPPPLIPYENWKRVVKDSEKLRPYLKDFISHKWSLKEIIGCHPSAPLKRYDYMGLLWLLRDKRIEEVTPDKITLKSVGRVSLNFRRTVGTLADQITLLELE